MERSHDLKAALDFLVNNAGERVILNVPRNSVLGAELNNFQTLKKESIAAGKELIIESIDDHILELAGLAGLTAINPVFKVKERVIADIVPRISLSPPVSPIKEIKEQPFVLETIKIKKVKPAKIKLRFSFQRILAFVFLMALSIFGAFMLLTEILPRATIAITLKKIPATFNESVAVSTNAASPNFATGSIVLPGELLTAKKNLEMSFPAAGRTKFESKAKGTLIVYNAHSSAPQTLVQNTRFLSPDGKIFRLDNRVTIPGAEVKNGKITPSKIEVEVTADAPGETYNVGPSSLWRIPGFQGTPKYDGFYAEATRPFTGGFAGERAEPNTEDLAQAKNKIESALKDALKSQMLILLKDRFKLVPGATVFNLLKEEIQPADEESGKISIFAEAEMKHFVFEEETLKKVLAEKGKNSIASNDNLIVSKFEINYGLPQIDFAQGKMILPVSGSLTYQPNIDAASIIEQVAGRDENNLKATIFSLPGLEKANVSLWPFWVKRVPAKSEKIKLIVE